MHVRLFLASLLIGVVCCGAASPLQAAAIDTWDGGPTFDLTGPQGGQYSAPVLGGERRIILSPISSRAAYKENIGLYAGGVGDSTMQESVQVQYGSPSNPLNVNLAAPGSAFYLKTGRGDAPDMGWQVILNSNGATIALGSNQHRLVGGPYYTIPLSDFTSSFPLFDFREVDAVTMRIDFYGRFGQVIVDEFGIVPEPSTVALLGIGVFTMRRRRLTADVMMNGPAIS